MVVTQTEFTLSDYNCMENYFFFCKITIVFLCVHYIKCLNKVNENIVVQKLYMNKCRFECDAPSVKRMQYVHNTHIHTKTHTHNANGRRELSVRHRVAQIGRHAHSSHIERGRVSDMSDEK